MMNIEDLKVEGTNFNVVDGKFVIPPSINQIKIDVGLAGDAPNSALWLHDTSDRFVFGVEPLPYHWENINELKYKHPKHKILQLGRNAVIRNNVEITKNISDRFCGIECAIDDVTDIEVRSFYEIDHREAKSGASTLLKPSKIHGHSVEKIIDVNTISLKTLFDHIPWDRFEYIEHLKTDCEGYDNIVINSLGDYIEKIVYISSELINQAWWEKTPNMNEFINYVKERDFTVLHRNNVGVDFVNNKLRDKIDIDKLNNKTAGL